MSDYIRGYRAAQEMPELGEELTSAEILSAGGPDFMAGEGSDEGPEFWRGWDAAVIDMRALVCALAAQRRDGA